MTCDKGCLLPIVHSEQCLCIQLDSFNRAASGRGGKLGRLFSGRKSSPKTPGKESPAKSDPATPPTQPNLSLDDMLIYQPVSLHVRYSGTNDSSACDSSRSVTANGMHAHLTCHSYVCAC